MRNKIITTLIVALAITQISYGAIVHGDSSYRQRTNEEWVSKAEVYNYFNELQKWLDQDSAVELLRKVASHSEIKGYRSEHTIDWDHIYDERDTKATHSIIRG